MPDSGNRREIARRNLPSECFWVNERIHLYRLLVRCVAIVTRANGVASQNDRNLRSRFQNLELGFHARVSLTCCGSAPGHLNKAGPPGPSPHILQRLGRTGQPTRPLSLQPLVSQPPTHDAVLQRETYPRRTTVTSLLAARCQDRPFCQRCRLGCLPGKGG